MVRAIRPHWVRVGMSAAGETVVVADVVSWSAPAPVTLALLVSMPVVVESTETAIVDVSEVFGAREPMLQVIMPPDSLQPVEAELNVTPGAMCR
jgi:hypothetical protein